MSQVWCNDTTMAATADGLWDHPIGIQIRYVRCGSQIAVHLSPALDIGGDPRLKAYISPAIEPFYRPFIFGSQKWGLDSISFRVLINNNDGLLQISKDGAITLKPLTGPAGNVGGWSDISITYDAAK